MTERERLELELEAVEEVIRTHCGLLITQIDRRTRIRGALNRARRLEREELQNGKHQS